MASNPGFRRRANKVVKGIRNMVPINEALQAEVWIGNEDSGFVREGQSVQLKIALYPFQKYGIVRGQVKHVSADASDAPGEDRTGKNDQPLTRFRAIVALGAQHLEARGVQHRLSPGMQVSAEIDLGSRTVMEYILSPMQKAFHEAGRER